MVGIRFGNSLFLSGNVCIYLSLYYYFCIVSLATVCQELWIFIYFIIGNIIVARLYRVQTFRLQIQDLAQTVLAFFAFEYDYLHVVSYH
jgi:hypothetical protein